MERYVGYHVCLILFQAWWWTWVIWSGSYKKEDGVVYICVILLALDVVFALQFTVEAMPFVTAILSQVCS